MNIENIDCYDGIIRFGFGEIGNNELLNGKMKII